MKAAAAVEAAVAAVVTAAWHAGGGDLLLRSRSRSHLQIRGVGCCLEEFNSEVRAC